MRPPRVLLGTLLCFIAVRLPFSCLSNEASKRLYVVAFINDIVLLFFHTSSDQWFSAGGSWAKNESHIAHNTC